jgi:hypothetical protein
MPKLLGAAYIKGKWRITQMPDYLADYPDMMEPAYIPFDGRSGGEFALAASPGAGYERSTPSTSPGTATTRWKTQWRRMGRTAARRLAQKDKSVFMAARKLTSPHAPG